MACPPAAVTQYFQRKEASTTPTATKPANGDLKRSADSSSEDSDAEPAKKAKPEEAATKKPASATSSSLIDAGKEARIEAEARAARQRALVPLDQRIRVFRQMLQERDVSAFSTWEKELKKIVCDCRYLLLTSEERKQVHTHTHTVHIALVPLDQRIRVFRQMLQERDVSAFSTWEKELKKIVCDCRYLLLTSEERKQVHTHTHTVHIALVPLDQRIRVFRQMLQERDVSAFSTWEKELKKIVCDCRYLLLTSEERKQVHTHTHTVHIALVPLDQRIRVFRQMLQERDVSAFSTWEKELKKIVCDCRYLLLTSEERKQVHTHTHTVHIALVPLDQRIRVFRQMLQERDVSAFSTWEKELKKIVCDCRYLLLTSEERKQVHTHTHTVHIALVPLDQRIRVFRQMLQERDVSAFSTWEKELKKIVCDCRYLLLTSEERKQVHTHTHTVHIALVPLDQRIRVFRQMLQERDVSAFSTWEKELKKIVCDCRYLLLTSEERKQVHTHTHTVHIALVPLDQRIRVFRQMLQERDVSAFSTWEKELKKIVCDCRYLLLTSEERKQVHTHTHTVHIALVPLDQRIRVFRQMLQERDVSAFSTWEKELKKIVCDCRYLLLTSEERKQVYNKYVRERAEEERKEKKNKLQQKKNAFKQLMEEAKLHSKSSFNDFSSKHGRDDRFKGIDKPRDRVTYFNEHVAELRKREKDDKERKREQAKSDFIALLKEKSIDRHARWADAKKKVDSEARYKAVESSTLREDYFREYCKIVKEERKKDKDQKEKERDRSSSKKEKKDKEREKDKDKEKDKEEKRDKDGKKEKKKEKGSEPEAATGSEAEAEAEAEADSDAESEAARERAARAQASIKEREREVQRALATSLRDRDKEREYHKRDEAVQHFNALLADLVRNPDLAWREAKKQLKKDHRYAAAELLTKEDKERLFSSHTSTLATRRRDKLRALLTEMGVAPTAHWRDVRARLRAEPTAPVYTSADKMEREFRDFQRDRQSAAKTALRQLLQETRSITHKTLASMKDVPGGEQLLPVHDMLKHDARYV
ncbi:trichohyalin-like isoform X2 [Cydia amplana]